MSERRRGNIRVVKDPVDSEEKLIQELMNELDGKDPEEEAKLKEKKAREKKGRRNRIIIAVVAIVLLIAYGCYAHFYTFKTAKLSHTYTEAASNDGSYVSFQNGILRYSRDGVTFLNTRGAAQWDQSYQIKTPIVDVSEESAAIADKGGNTIVVLTKDGLKGEITTTLPIEKISVSEQGIVCAILEDENEPRIVCYDAAGNLLIEHKTSFDGTGYPVSASISEDGEGLQVVYDGATGTDVCSKVVFYDFSEESGTDGNHIKASFDYEGTIMANGAYMDDKNAMAIGDDKVIFYRVEESVEETAVIELDKKIKLAVNDEDYVALVLYGEGEAGYELRLYDTDGEEHMSENFTGEYKHISMERHQVILYDGKKCNIFLASGIHKFVGEMNENIQAIVPVSGINKYVVMDVDGMEIVRLSR